MVVPSSSLVLPQFAYTIDGGGRPYTAKDVTNSLNLVTGVTYNSSSSATAITYGNGDSDSYTPDPNTNRVTTFKNVVTGSSAFTDTGTLGWNPNGSLHTFGWVDGNNTTLNQSCTYSSDPLNRIAAVNCGSPWGQTFAYDAFGNVTKTGNGGTSYMATYNAQTNQVASGVTATYDANGNQMQTNFVSPMSYDANHNAVAAGSTSMTYDALGRLVEFGGKPVVYGPSGEKLAVFNGTAYTASIALPGGGEAYYTSGALTSLRRKDWLGSSRLATSWAHAVVSKAAYAPYGETYGTAGTTDLDFTGQTQSSVSTLFDFPARKYDPNAGRWTVPDPGAWGVVDPTNPQSFNRYAYVLNMPMVFIDPLGLDPGCDDQPGGVCPGNPCGYSVCDVIAPPDPPCYQDASCIVPQPTQPYQPPAIGWDQNIGYIYASVTSAPNNGRNCSAGSASAGQYVAATAEAATLTSQWASGLGPGNRTLGRIQLPQQ
jgi:RHS repeat-associated protein